MTIAASKLSIATKTAYKAFSIIYISLKFTNDFHS